MKTLMFVVLMFIGIAVKAQTVVPVPSDLQALEQWLAAQQTHLGSGFGLTGIKYANTWWDAVSVGQAGLNIGKAGSLDYLDFGPTLSIANDKTPRYGIALPIHVGNIWNSLKLPGTIATHVWLANLPNVTLAPAIFYPANAPLTKWTWNNDFQIVLAYTFGGS